MITNPKNTKQLHNKAEQLLIAKSAALARLQQEMKIEASLEKVRTIAMAMRRAEDMLTICKIISKQLTLLGMKEIRNVQTAIFYKSKGTYMNYEYYAKHNKTFITDVDFKNHKIQSAFAKRMMKGANEKMIEHLKGKKMIDWYAYQKTTNQFADKYILKAHSLNYYWYSLGPVALGTSTYYPLTKKETDLFKRFLKVFELAYRRYLDIEKAEAQSREAQIEAALERIRSISMAIRSSSELMDIIHAVFGEWKKLGLELYECNINLFDRDTKVWTNWGSGIGDAALPSSFVFPWFDDPFVNQLYEDTCTGISWRTYSMGGKDKKKFLDGMFAKTDFKNAPEQYREALYSIPELYLTHAFMQYGSMDVVGPDSPPEAIVDILKRFAKVFEQAYTRYLDVVQAEAQAREAQIELALERVRARSMAMQHSEELQDTSLVLFQQLKELGEPAEQCTIGIIKESEGVVEIAATLHGNVMQQTFRHKIEEPFVMNKMFRAWKAHQRTLILELNQEELQQYNQYRNELVGKEMFPVKLHPGNRRIIHIAYFSKGMLALATNEPRPAESLQLLERFAKVFEQTYTRFLDLQKAEAQAKEAQIEAALERVRSRTMGMQKSEELKEIIKVVVEQLVHLNINVEHAGFIMDYKERDDMHIWLADQHSIPSEVTFPYFDSPHWNSFVKAKEQDTDFFTNLLSFDEKNKFYKELFKLFPVPDEAKKYYFNCAGLAISTVLLDNVGLYIENFAGVPYTDEENNTLMRFGKVFQQTYTRFNDLQKAEAQAREAKIEAGLEKVRSKTMAMHKSEEVTGVAVSLNEELLKLGFEGGSTIIIINRNSGDTEQWTGFSEDKSLKSCYVPYFQHPCHDAVLDAWEKDENFLVYTLTGDEKRSLDEHYFTTGFKDFPDSDKKWMREMESVTFSHAFMKYGAIHWGPNYLTEEQLRILQRFSKVFEQSYTRFLDLQKAEAQAREAKIEAALERVRSRSMAMHKSEELADLSLELVKQVQALGVATWFCAFNIYDDPKSSLEWGSNGEGTFPRYRTPREGIFLRYYKAGQRGETLLINEIGESDCPAHYEYLCTLPGVGEQLLKMKAAGISFPVSQIDHVAYFKYGYIIFITYKSVPESHDIFIRFAKVFEQTYTRFLDLQKAEAQAREAQIEAALERVRSRTMAMHKSDELLEAGEILFLEMQKLGIESLTAGYVLMDKEEKNGLNYTPDPSTKKILPLPVIIPHDETVHMQQVAENWKKGNSFYVVEMDEEETIRHQTFIAERSTNFPLNAEQLIAISPAKLFLHNFYFKEGYLLIVGGSKLSAEQNDIMLRFTKVFQQTYTRFLDLQKAEGQARESQIQLALERVRARTMAMQKSDELPEAANLLFQQVQSLGMPAWSAGYCIWSEDKKSVTLYMSSEGVLQPPFKAPTTEDELFIQMRKGHEKGKSLHVVEMSGEQLAAHYRYMRTLPVVGEVLDSIIEAGHPLPTFQVMHYAYFSKGYLLFITYEPVPDAHNIFKRFAKVFEQTYTRFLDLQKAEAQTREAQIEVAVERVRAKALSMHRSGDLHSVVVTLKNELMSLQIPGVTASTIYLEQEDGTIRILDISDSGEQEDDPSHFKMDKVIRLEDTDPDLWIRRIWNGTDNYFVVEADEADFKRVVAWLYTIDKEGARIAEKIIQEKSIKRAWLPTVKLEKGRMNIDLLEPPTREIESILLKMGAGFDLAYKRFLDLQKAEAQAKEAQIELGLERVRARAMAMQKSDELKELISTVSTELGKLDIVLDRCFIITYDIATMDATWWIANPETPGEALGLFMKYHEHPPYLAHIEAWKQRKFKWQYILEGETKKEWDKFLFVETELSKLPPFIIENMRSKEKVYLSSSFNNFGYLSLATLDPLPEEQFDILLRFAKVFDLTFTRFNDLQKAEAQAKEAHIETALEKVRSRTMAMQSSNELQETAAVLFNEFKKLGTENIYQVTIGIYNEEEGVIDFRSTSWADDGAQDNRSFSLSMEEPTVIKPAVAAWKANKKSLVIDLSGEALQEWLNYRNKISGVTKMSTDTGGRRVITAAYYSKGHLSISTPVPVPTDTLRTLERFAAVFDSTYTRFLDLKKAEAQALRAEQDLIAIKEAKQKAEEALIELQVTQKQLIQSEKMASLGELTAGIAHEIQNPLNFVNNFSEVSKELLDEMKQAIEKGDADEAKEIMNDVIQNLDKINHHGKRADGIVKGMLQHSRSSSNQKEPTDINALADEYLRLAYHGLRAKDKSFNAAMETNFDESIGKINIISQDIGRVILNLITNAFYAVNEKRKTATDSYEPTIIVTTNSVIQPSGSAAVEVKVSDNGGGIPQRVLDKIFQPFFTTKPTGQGTGLGLSLSYDIVKAHGGELKVETTESKGSQFIISLPVN